MGASTRGGLQARAGPEEMGHHVRIATAIMLVEIALELEEVEAAVVIEPHGGVIKITHRRTPM